MSTRFHVARQGLPCLALAALLLTPALCRAANWQYRVPYDRGVDAGEASALLWMPPESKVLRGLLILGKSTLEDELVSDPEVRKACRESDVGIVYFTPHFASTFHFWVEGNTDGVRLLKALADLAVRSGHLEVARVPWIPAGQARHAAFARNVAYWKPERVAAILQLKDGDLLEKEHLPPTGSLTGIPLLAVNGQFERASPQGALRPDLGRETRWLATLEELQQLRAKDPNYLVSLVVEPGADHFLGSREVSAYAALFIRKTAQYRLPKEVPPGEGPVACLPLKAEDGWLTHPDLRSPAQQPAPYQAYKGDKGKALWHYDQEMAEAHVKFHANFSKHQMLDTPAPLWLADGDGWEFTVTGKFLDTIPEDYGGALANLKVTHATTPILFRCKDSEPVVQLAPDRFRVVRPVKAVNICTFNAGDENHHATIRWGMIAVLDSMGTKRPSIRFPPLSDTLVAKLPRELPAQATSDLPVHFEVDYGPLVVTDGRLVLSELPQGAKFPIECRVTATQMGRRIAPEVSPAMPVSQIFKLLGP